MPDKVTPEHIRGFAERLRHSMSGEPDTGAITQGVHAVYQAIAHAPAQTVWCASPMQFTNMPQLHVSLAEPTNSRGVARANLISTYKRASKRLKIAGADQFWAEIDRYYARDAKEHRQPGALLSSTITVHLIRKLMTSLYTQTDEKIGLHERQVLEKLFNDQFSRPSLRQLKGLYQTMGFRFYARELLYLPPSAVSVGTELAADTKESEELVTLRQLSIFSGTVTWGIWDVMPVMFFDCVRSAFPGQIFFEETDDRLLDVWVQLFQRACSYMFFENLCYVCPYPLKHSVDELGRWHNGDGPAAEFGDGQKIYFWHGTPIDEKLITRKQLINPLTIDFQPNTELRRIMMEIYGLDKYLRRSGAKRIHQDEYGTLYRKHSNWLASLALGAYAITVSVPEQEPVLAVEVKNSTPEPDGTYKTYFLRVPPTMTTAKEAIAWTFGLSADEYGPTSQT